MKLHLDFETLSSVDLKQAGLWNYAHSMNTDVTVIGWALGDEPVQAVTLRRGMIHGDVSPLIRHVQEGGTVAAWNAAFELMMWNLVLRRYGFPPLKWTQMHDPMAKALAMGLPGTLSGAAKAVGTDHQKDDVGYQLMLRLCKPTPKGDFLLDRARFTFMGETWTPDQALTRLAEYCKKDVAAERAVDERTVDLSARERKVWLLDQKINYYGVPFDMEAVHAARDIRDQALKKLDRQMAEATNGAVAKTTALPALKDWLSDYGVFVKSLDKHAIDDLLGEECLPAAVEAALNYRKEANRATSVTKLDAVARQADSKGRVHFQFAYHKSHTGRWAGRDVQLHNFTRDLPGPETVESVLRLVKARDLDALEAQYGSAIAIISQCLRGFIRTPKQFVGGDWSNIEGRGLAWLAGEQWKVKAFAEYDEGTGPDIYLRSYSECFHVPIEELPPKGDERQLGKVVELALGYQGGVGAFKSMAETYGVVIPDDEAIHRIKFAWRDTHPNIQQYWWDVENAAHKAVRYKNSIFHAGPQDRRVSFRVAGSFLWCRLPSGRVLCYPYPELREGDKGIDLTYMKMVAQQDRSSVVTDKKNSGQWCRVKTYGGKLTENITQAVCGDILREALLRADELGYFCPLHIHDEMIAEGNLTENDRQRLHKCMTAQPVWAKGFPLAADLWLAQRYRKE